jgi:hypothetical protein
MQFPIRPLLTQKCHVSWVSWRIMSSGLDDWIYWRLLCTVSLNYKQYSPIADLHTLQFTVAHAIGFLVSISRILATDLNTGTITSSRYLRYCHLLPTGHSTGTPLPILQSNLVKVKFEVTLPLAVYRQSVHLGIKPLETHDQIFFSSELLR